MVHVSQSSGQPIEEGRKKAKVIAAVWGTEVIQFLATLSILPQDELKNRMESSYSLAGANHPILPLVLVLNALSQKHF